MIDGTHSQNLAQALLKHQTVLKQFIRRSVSQESDVEDIYQKMLLKVLKRRSDSDIQNPLSYGFKMAENSIAEYIRESQRHPDELAVEPICEKSNLEEQLHYHQRLNLYQQVLTDMPALRREAFVRRKFHGQSRTEIADAMTLSEEAVKKHITRAMDDLKCAVQRQLHEGH
ncbi:hypothetical protein GCM10011357_01520 [Lacimicrobium alkaliphilum]|uniref:RNA polymerase subunit sigma-70 n=1 Tax=Lacimicrobium alkaliphilum TaxID=1526571 RepID=A0ABQ1QZ11_9ALTE|nr:hypothetical protein GCM10011357_01520 [Lacimicrobium alkaliphilum]